MAPCDPPCDTGGGGFRPVLSPQLVAVVMPREAAHVALKSWMAVNAVSAGVASAAEEEEEEEENIADRPFWICWISLSGPRASGASQSGVDPELVPVKMSQDGS